MFSARTIEMKLWSTELREAAGSMAWVGGVEKQIGFA